MTSSNKILVGLVAGITTGLFLGEHIAPIKILANAFIKLLQMSVLPYLTVSLILSLGSLSLEQARRLGLRAGGLLAGLWTLALGFTFLFPLAFPTIQTGSFFSSTLVEQRPRFDFLELYIPANPFHSLANNIVPAVVLFSIVMGVALIGVDRKGPLLEVLEAARLALSRATRFVVSLTPYGIFAVSANTAGTLNLQQLERIQIYLLAYVVIALLMAFWVLPGLIAALTSISYSDVLGPARDALITAFIVGDLFIVLPILIESCEEVLSRQDWVGKHAKGAADVLVPASFNFPHVGKLLSLSFVLFAGWFSDAPISLSEYPRLAITGLLTFFGSLNAAIPFLLDSFRIPADTFQLFLATGVINSRIGTLVAAVHTITIGLLGSAALLGAVRFQGTRILRYGLITLLLTLAAIGGLRLLFSRAMRPNFKGSEIVLNMHPLLPPVEAKVYRETLPRGRTEEPRGKVLDRIKAKNVLRVGYLGNRPPYSYFNGRSELVGLDIEMASRLSVALNVSLEFVPVSVDEMSASLAFGEVDIVMSGIVVSPQRAEIMLFTEPYQDETLAFLVKDYLREDFSTWENIRNLRAVKISAPGVPYFISYLREKLPEAKIEPISLVGNIFQNGNRPEVLLMPAERGSILTLVYPEYSVVVPEPGLIKVPLAYPIARQEVEWQSFLNTWIEIERRQGTIGRLYEHWVLGKNVEKQRRRWSVIRNVLHWVE